MPNYDIQLIPCTLNGVELPLLRFANEHARALAVHSYLDMPGGDADDSGAEPLEVELEAMYGGQTAHVNLRALMSMIEATIPPLVLTHPVYGPMPVAVRSARSTYEAGKQRHLVTLRVVRDTPTVSLPLSVQVIYEIPAAPTLAALNMDFAALAALLSLLLSIVNALRSAILSALNAMAALGYLAATIDDIAADQIGFYGDYLTDVVDALMGGVEGVGELPDDIAAAAQEKFEEFKEHVAFVFGVDYDYLRELENGETTFAPGRFVSGFAADGGPTETTYAQLAAYTGLVAAAAAGLAETVAAQVLAAESADTLTAASASRALTIAHRQVVRAQRLARQVLPGGQTSAALLQAAASLIRVWRTLKIRNQYVEAVSLRTAPLHLVVYDYGVGPEHLARIIRANELDDLLAVAVGAKIWLPREAVS